MTACGTFETCLSVDGVSVHRTRADVRSGWPDDRSRNRIDENHRQELRGLTNVSIGSACDGDRHDVCGFSSGRRPSSLAP